MKLQRLLTATFVAFAMGLTIYMEQTASAASPYIAIAGEDFKVTFTVLGNFTCNKAPCAFDPLLSITATPPLPNGLTIASGSAVACTGNSCLPAWISGVPALTAAGNPVLYTLTAKYASGDKLTQTVSIQVLPQSRELVSTCSVGASNVVNGSSTRGESGAIATNCSMSEARFHHTATLLPSGKVLIAGGSLTFPADNTAELYDPATATFSLTGKLITGRTQHAATALSNGTVLITGGGSTGVLNSAEIYNPTTGTFSAVAAKMTTTRYAHSSVLLSNGNVLIVGGDYPPPAVSTAEIYSPSTGKFTAVGKLHALRNNPSVTLMSNGKVLVSGGWTTDDGSANSLATAEVFDPAKSTFAVTTGPMSIGRSSQAAVAVSTGVLVVGGQLNAGDIGDTASAELYSTSTGKFTSAGSLVDAPSGVHMNTATPLMSGEILLFGGPTSSANIYNPDTKSFAAFDASNYERVGHTATAISNCRVLITGGLSAGGNLTYFKDALIFHYSGCIEPAQ